MLSPVPLFLTPWTEDDGGADGADERATVMGMMGTGMMGGMGMGMWIRMR